MNSSDDSQTDELSSCDEDVIDCKNDSFSKNLKNNYEYSSRALTVGEIANLMLKSTEDICTIIKQPPVIVRNLANHFKWDMEQLLEVYYCKGQDKLFDEAGIANICRSKSNDKNFFPEARDCEICYETFWTSNVTYLGCNHYFCDDCWNDYLKSKIVDEGMAEAINCPGFKCQVLVDDDKVMRLLKDIAVICKYQQFITDSFVKYHKLIKWCPSPGCTNAVQVSSIESRAVYCKCEHSFCFRCMEDNHDPVKCEMLRIWRKNSKEEAENAKWISKNAKPCPGCGANIEKNGGCNNMYCIKCHRQFNWMQVNNDQKNFHLLTEKFTFYYERYLNHQQSMKLENKLYCVVYEKMEELQVLYDMSNYEVVFFKEAVDILCQCRQTLMYTYVFAFYLKSNNQAEIFSANQIDLQNATEILSGYLEREITDNDLKSLKRKIKGQSKYCEDRRLILLNHVHEGHDHDWWEFSEESLAY